MLQVPFITAANSVNDNIVLAGLSTLPNQLSEVPQTPTIGMVIANDVVIDKDGTLTTRRGVEYLLTTPGGEPSIADGISFDENIVFLSNTTTTHTGSTYNLYTSSSSTALSTGLTLPQINYNNSGNYFDQSRFYKNNNNLYFLTNKGAYKLESTTSSPILAGAPPGLDGIATLNSGTAGGFMNTNATVAYRVEWQYTDTNNNLIVGAPSSRFLVANTSYGYQTIDFGGTIASGTQATGLANTTTQYNCSIGYDGTAPVTVQIEGQNAQTFDALISQIETIVTGVNVTIVGGNLVVTSNDNNLGSAVNVIDGSTSPLFGSCTGFVAVDAAVPSTRNVDITILIPAEIRLGTSGPYGNVSWTYIVYRGNQSSDAVYPGDDECQQVYTSSPSSADLTNGYITFTDSLDDSYRGTTIDTAPSQYGAGGGNYAPPNAVDVETYRNFTFYANTQSQAFLNVTLVDVGSPSGLQVGDTITISSPNFTTITLTGGTAEDVSTNTFLVETAQDPATNIQLTAQSICKVLNLCAANNVAADWNVQLNAFYTSAFGALPGAMVFNTRGPVAFSSNNIPGTQFFTFNSSRSAAFNPNLPSTGATSSNSGIADLKPNRLYISKFLQPESVPVGLSGYEIDVGSPSNAILGIKATRDVLFIFKGGADEGIFYITGTDPTNFQTLPFDQTVHLISPNSMQLLNNAIYFFSDQGIVNVSASGGVQINSRPIEYDLLSLTTANFPNFLPTSWGLAYQSDRKYIVGVQTYNTDVYSTQCYVYNYFTNNWTKWTREFNGGFINELNDQAYYFLPSKSTLTDTGAQILVERKSFSNSDYSDESYAITIASVNGNVITVDTASLPYVQVGYVVTQGIYNASVESIDTFNNITLSPTSTSASWTTGSATITIPISPYFMTHPIYCGTPNIVKHFGEISFDLGSSTFTKLTVSFNSDWAPTAPSSKSTIVLPAQNQSGTYGYTYYGTEQYGGSSVISVINNRKRSLVPLPYQRANWIQPIFSLSEINGAINLQGIGLVYTLTSPAQK